MNRSPPEIMYPTEDVWKYIMFNIQAGQLFFKVWGGGGWGCHD